MVVGEHAMPFDARTRRSLHHQSLQGEAVDNLPMSVLPHHCAESLRPLAHSQETCKTPERDSQNGHGDHERSDSEPRQSHELVSFPQSYRSGWGTPRRGLASRPEGRRALVSRASKEGSEPEQLVSHERRRRGKDQGEPVGQDQSLASLGSQTRRQDDQAQRRDPTDEELNGVIGMKKHASG
jgi:hypothetical protein